MSEIKVTELPEGELGTGRYFSADHTQHGDLFLATWTGEVDHRPSPADDVSACFNVRHGAEALILASFIGYYRRTGATEAETTEVFTEAATEVLGEDLGDLRGHGSLQVSEWREIARGEGTPWADIPDLWASCLLPVIPSRPGPPDRVGGMSVHARRTPADRLLLVAHPPASRDYSGELPVSHSAEFCMTDIQAMARVLCGISMGEYRKDIQKLIHDILIEGEPKDY